MTKVRAKMRCTEVNHSETGHSVAFRPVTGGSPENERFYKYTPGGEITLSVVSQDIAANFMVGKDYYVDFTAADS